MMNTARGNHDKERAALIIALPKHGPESTGLLRAAQDSADLDVRGEPFAHVAERSGRVAFIGSHQNGRKRIPAARAAHLFERGALANHTADGGKRAQMLGARIRR